MSKKASLWLFIDGTAYRVEKMKFDNPAIRGWSLTKFEASAPNYQVIRDGNSLTCQCADFVMQREKKGERCKHIRKLVEIFGESL